MFPETRGKRGPPRTTYSRKDTTGTAKKRRRAEDVSGNTSTSTDTPSPSRSSSIPVPSDNDDDDEDSDNFKVGGITSSPPPPPVKKPFVGFSVEARTSATTTASITSRRRKQPEQQKKLTQLKIDLGQPQRATCQTCGMSYYPCTSDDDALHRRFHAKSVGGVDFKPTILDAKKSKVVWRGREEEEQGGDSFVLVVDRKSAAVERRKAREVLEVVESELSAGEIGEGALWGGVKAGEGGGGDDGGERFRVLLYVVGKKCVGLCLAERIRKAYRVVGDEVRNDTAGEMKSMVYRGSSISISETPRPAILGISRVWVCADRRRRGIATRLLDCAREHFIYGMKIEKDDVAFSQPTESGGALARGWFGADKAHHWAVYVEEV